MVNTLTKGYCDIIPRHASPDTIEGCANSVFNPLLSPLKGGNNNRTPYIPHTLAFP